MLLVIVLSFSTQTFAKQYQTSAAFINQSFAEVTPKPQLLWLSQPIKLTAEKILGHKLSFLRTRYWNLDKRSVWILEEIGKTQEITIGIIIDNAKIEKIKVLAFRESRGWEVKHDFFTDQFKQVAINTALHLDQHIDGIAGATLSVRALKRVARLALFFDQQIHQ